MTSEAPLIRPIMIFDREIEEHLMFLERFLGSTRAIDCRIEQVERVIQLEREHTVYLRYWVLPNASFWLGMRDARKLIRSRDVMIRDLSPSVQRSLEIAAKLKALQDSMSNKVRDEFRGRLLGNDFLSPTFYEIDTAAHFWQQGYEIQWCDPPEEPGERIPEFVAYSSSHEFEVECKSESKDSGRKILLPHFYRLVDRLAAPLSTDGFVGRITIFVANRMPSSVEWQNQLVEAVRELAGTGARQIRLSDGTAVDVDLYRTGGLLVPGGDIDAKVQAIKTPYSYVAVFCKQDKGVLVNSLIVKMESRSADGFLKGVFKDLKDANRQFSGERSALICCFLPEVDSFDGLGTNSALLNMTFTFFKRHANPFVFAVSYTSDATSTHSDTSISRSSPSITFENPHYDEGFGPRISVYQAVSE